MQHFEDVYTTILTLWYDQGMQQYDIYSRMHVSHEKKGELYS